MEFTARVSVSQSRSKARRVCGVGCLGATTGAWSPVLTTYLGCRVCHPRGESCTHNLACFLTKLSKIAWEAKFSPSTKILQAYSYQPTSVAYTSNLTLTVTLHRQSPHISLFLSSLLWTTTSTPTILNCVFYITSLSPRTPPCSVTANSFALVILTAH